MCGDKFIDDLCALVGNTASNWGYFESEIIFVLTKRLEVYFNTFEISNNLGEFKFLIIPVISHYVDICMKSLGYKTRVGLALY